MLHRSVITRALKGERASCEALARHCLPILHRYFTKTWKASKSDVEELVQDTFVELWKGLSLFRGAAIEPWLLTIARRIAWKRFNNKAPSPLSLDDKETGEEEAHLPFPSSSPNQEELIITKDRYQKLVEMFSRLRTEYREVLHLYYTETLTVEELAHVLEIPEGTARTWLQRARKELHRQWRKKS